MTKSHTPINSWNKCIRNVLYFCTLSRLVDAVSSRTVPQAQEMHHVYFTQLTRHYKSKIVKQWGLPVWMGKQLRAQWEMNYWGHFGISTCRGQYVLAVNHTFSIAGFQKHAEKKNLRPTMEHFFTVNTRRCCGWLLSCCSMVAKVFWVIFCICYVAILLGCCLLTPVSMIFRVPPSFSSFAW